MIGDPSKGQNILQGILSKLNKNNAGRLVRLGCGTSLHVYLKGDKNSVGFTLYPDISLYQKCGIEIEELAAIQALSENISQAQITPNERTLIDYHLRITKLEEELFSMKHKMNSEMKMSITRIGI